jgi:hypothetical protein
MNKEKKYIAESDFKTIQLKFVIFIVGMMIIVLGCFAMLVFKFKIFSEFKDVEGKNIGGGNWKTIEYVVDGETYKTVTGGGVYSGTVSYEVAHPENGIADRHGWIVVLSLVGGVFFIASIALISIKHKSKFKYEVV